MAINISRYQVQLVKERGARYELNKKVDSLETARKVFLEVFNLNRQAEEVLTMITLDTKNNITGAFEISRGTLNTSTAHPREIYKRALLQNSASIILAHNHPSGECTPSADDVEITARLKNAGQLLGIQLLDHIIIGHEDRYYSFAQNGKI